MSKYNILEIPHPVSDQHVAQYSETRLLGLRTDSQAFGPLYDSESKRTHQQWREHLEKRGKTIFVACNGDSLDHSEWVGIMHLLTPKLLDGLEWHGSRYLVLEDEAPYLLMGLWIHPDHRRQGLGKRLLDAVMMKAMDDDTGAEGRKNKVMILHVTESNAVQSLYAKAGFQERVIGQDSKGTWMTLRHTSC